MSLRSYPDIKYHRHIHACVRTLPSLHDDASTDGTQDIIRAYEKKYPDKVKSIIEKENLFSQGKLGAVFYDSRLAGKYLAICDGDDYMR